MIHQEALQRDLLAQGLDKMNLDVTPQVTRALMHYLYLLAKWNRVFNLISVRDPARMVSHHILDSLSVAPYIRGPWVLDAGTGGGLPGIPLALVLPRWRFVLLDSRRKKTRFVTQAVAELGLSNVTVVNERLEAYRPETLFDTVVSRAFATLAGMVAAAGRLCREEGCIVAMKGRYPGGEIMDVPPAYEVSAVTRLSVPGLAAERHVVQIRHIRSLSDMG